MADRVKEVGFHRYMMGRAKLLGESSDAVARDRQLSHEMALGTALGVASAACQGCVDIKTPEGGKLPASLAILIVAESGQGKSTANSLFSAGLEGFQEEKAEAFDSKKRSHDAKDAVWKSRRDKIKRAIAKRQDDCESTADLEWSLEEHLKRQPITPMQFQMLYKDVSPSAMLESMRQFRIAALISGEGGDIIDGKMFESIPHMNSAWSAETINIVRSGKPKISIYGPRLTICIMIQPGVLDLQPRKKAKRLADSGHWARYMVFTPVSTKGGRVFTGAKVDMSPLDAFNRRVRELLEYMYEEVEQKGGEREVLEFSPAAADYWRETSNKIQRQQWPGEPYERAPDHAQKLGENIARLAGIIHYFEGFAGSIAQETVELAETICLSASEGYMRLFVPPPEEEQYAALLWPYLQGWAQQGVQDIPKNHILQYGPKPLRRARELNLGLGVLMENNCAMVIAGERNAQWIRIAPMYMPTYLPG